VAQDLHDGLAQDLAIIVAHGRQMAEHLGGEHPLAVAASRALSVSRDTISDLSDLSHVRPREALEAVGQELGSLYGVAVAVSVHPDVELATAAREQVLRIAREAIANAARHGHAQNVLVSLKRTASGLVLKVQDDGDGILGPAGPAPEGFGMGTMRERAASLGGFLAVRAPGGGGTELRVVFQ
jgi:signal transduction histidine kinase